VEQGAALLFLLCALTVENMMLRLTVKQGVEGSFNFFL